MIVLSRSKLLRNAVFAVLLLLLVMPLGIPPSAVAKSIIAEHQLPTGSSGPSGIVTGPDGNLWIALQISNQIARMSPDGKVTLFHVPQVDGGPLDIMVGPDNALWFAEYGPHGKLGRITTDGNITEFDIGKPTARVWGVTTGPDGDIWFTEFTEAAKDGE